MAVYNAGAILWKPVMETPLPRFDLLHEVNVRGAYVMVQHALPHFLERKSGRIILVSPPIYKRLSPNTAIEYWWVKVQDLRPKQIFFSFKAFWGYRRKSIFHRTLWQNLWEMQFDSMLFIDFSLTYCPFLFFFHGTGSSKGRPHTASVKSGWLCWRMAWLMSSKTLVCQQLFLCLKLLSKYLMFHHLIVYVFFSIKHNVTSIKYQSSIMPYGQITELQYKLNSVFCDTKQSSLSCRTGSGTLNFDIETTFFITYF